jgi:hypothetical protein
MQALSRSLLSPWGCFPASTTSAFDCAKQLADFAPQCNLRRTLAILPDSTGAGSLGVGFFGPFSMPEREHANAIELDSSVLQSSLSVCFLPGVAQILDIAIDNDSSKI